MLSFLCKMYTTLLNAFLGKMCKTLLSAFISFVKCIQHCSVLSFLFVRCTEHCPMLLFLCKMYTIKYSLDCVHPSSENFITIISVLI